MVNIGSGAGQPECGGARIQAGQLRRLRNCASSASRAASQKPKRFYLAPEHRDGALDGSRRSPRRDARGDRARARLLGHFLRARERSADERARRKSRRPGRRRQRALVPARYSAESRLRLSPKEKLRRASASAPIRQSVGSSCDQRMDEVAYARTDRQAYHANAKVRLRLSHQRASL